MPTQRNAADDGPNAEACLQRAPAIVSEREAAYHLLADVCGRFTEGSDQPDVGAGDKFESPWGHELIPSSTRQNHAWPVDNRGLVVVCLDPFHKLL